MTLKNKEALENSFKEIRVCINPQSALQLNSYGQFQTDTHKIKSQYKVIMTYHHTLGFSFKPGKLLDKILISS